MEQLDFLSDEAKKIGAVNTILLKDDKLYGYNSDYYGFGSLLKVNNIEVNIIKIKMAEGYCSASFPFSSLKILSNKALRAVRLLI